MRWICWAILSLAVCALVSAAAGTDSAYGGGGSCGSCEQNYSYYAPACASPFHGMVPGCCELPPSPCDNAWAGYCQEKARCRSFWHRLGTGGATHCGSAPTCCQSAPTCCQSVPTGCQPTSSAPPQLYTDSAPRPVVRVIEPPVGKATVGPARSSAAAAPGEIGETPAPMVPAESAEIPLPPEPAALDRPIALPPVPSRPPDDTTRRWSPSWLPRSNARNERAAWPRLK